MTSSTRDKVAAAGVLDRRFGRMKGMSEQSRKPHQDPVPPDPSGIPEPHDVLAAEEFGIGTRDERFPADPTGNPNPHDVLAAEEFPMPTGNGAGPGAGRAAGPPAWVPLLLLAAVAAIVVLRRRA
jgi:hypothetical protein